MEGQSLALGTGKFWVLLVSSDHCLLLVLRSLLESLLGSVSQVWPLLSVGSQIFVREEDHWGSRPTLTSIRKEHWKLQCTHLGSSVKCVSRCRVWVTAFFCTVIEVSMWKVNGLRKNTPTSSSDSPRTPRSCYIYQPHPTLGVFSALPSLKPISPFLGSEKSPELFPSPLSLIFISDNIMKLCYFKDSVLVNLELQVIFI